VSEVDGVLRALATDMMNSSESEAAQHHEAPAVAALSGAS
jgi:hypothetical protein